MVKLVDTRGLSPLEAMLYIGSRPIIHAEVKTKYADWIKRAIDNLECSQEFSERNFALAKTKDKQGKERRSFNITKDGFTFLAMGFTGKEAARFKEAYIKAFNNMAEHIRNYKEKRQDARVEYKPMTDAIKLAHDPIKSYHFSNEADLINSIVIGMTAKRYKELNKVDSVRDNLKPFQLEAIAHLERMNTALIEINQPFEERKRILNEYYSKKLIKRLAV